MNKYRNEFVAEINGVEYKLRATFEAMVGIEEVTNSSLPQLAQAFSTGAVRATHLIAIIENASVEKVNKEELQKNLMAAGIVNTAMALTEFFEAALYGVPQEKKQ